MSIFLKNPLTGVYIREFLEETLIREIARAERYDRPLCIALLCIDDFTKIHKENGKEISDQVLALVTARMQMSLRKSDSLISEWTPSEFMICLMECGLKNALTIMERIKSRIFSETLCVLSKEIPVTLSMGIAALRTGLSMESLIQEAQYALKQAQQAGKNQIRHFAI